MLQSERDTSPAVARATAELLRGRMGTAASKLLQPYVLRRWRPGWPRLDERADEARAVLQAILQLAGTLRELGVTADPSVKARHALRARRDRAVGRAGYDGRRASRDR